MTDGPSSLHYAGQADDGRLAPKPLARRSLLSFVASEKKDGEGSCFKVFFEATSSIEYQAMFA